MHWRAGVPRGYFLHRITLLTFNQFAYLQLGTVIATIIRKVELRLQDGVTNIPEHNYHVRLFSSLFTGIVDLPSIDHDYDA
jgi:hypothetical protein